MLGIIFLKNESSYLNKVFKLNSINIMNINNCTKVINLCFNNIEKKQQQIKFVEKIINKLKKNNIDKVLIQKDIYIISKELINKFRESDIQIITGNNIYEKNLNNIITYILDNNSNLQIEQVNLGILINKITYKRLEYIKQMASKVKCMTIITEDKLKFENTCTNIFENEGLSIKLSDNFRSGLKGSTIIVNFDIENKNILDNIPNNCIYINFGDCAEKMKKSFKGIIVNDIKVKIDKEENNLIQYLDENKFRNLAIAEAITREDNNYLITHLVGIKGNIPISDIQNFDVIKKKKKNRGKKNKKWKKYNNIIM